MLSIEALEFNAVNYQVQRECNEIIGLFLLTSYVARHSYASIADDMEVPITVISQMLGHQKISTTQSYLTDLRKNRLDEYQDKVVKGL
ncbi:tyrosine-type recombinase/integrase [bacterium]|nr:tyrosine-type recombinase/integrase [bacterium]